MEELIDSVSSPFSPEGFEQIDRREERETEREGAKETSVAGPVSSSHSESVQTGRLESHRWPNAHKRSIMKLWRRQRLLGACWPEMLV